MMQDEFEIMAVKSFSQTYLLIPRTQGRPNHREDLQRLFPALLSADPQLPGRICNRILCIDTLSFTHHIGKYIGNNKKVTILPYSIQQGKYVYAIDKTRMA
ncbi:hypothetical protein METP3_01391 [Methanosarcinales archaeon]|nr:hypothetical protein METP3_01391 [Methanosarcinales archaeon]